MMTEKDNIERLLEKFMLGETTEQEERLLALYFATEKNIPDEWKEYAAMFAAFADGEPSFSEQEKDAFCGVVERNLSSQNSHSSPRTPNHYKLRAIRWIAAAASVALLVVLILPNKTEEPLSSLAAVSREITKDSTGKANPGRDDLFVAQDLNPGDKSEKQKSSPSVYPGAKPCATNSPSLQDDSDENDLICNSDELVHYCRYDGDINAPRMHTDLEVRQIMLECEQVLLEEEFQENDIKYRTVSL